MRKALLLMLTLMIAISFAGCGKKDAGDIVSDLEAKINDLESYKAVGTMKIQTGENPQVYSVEVWYMNPHYYRIALNNVNSKVTQIVLRNDDGVFVLDPALNKSYRFKSDWPESNGAVYLYQSLAKSIIDDPDRVFTVEDDLYMFDVKANYQNQTLTKQYVWLDKDLRPVKVAVFDPNETQLVEMMFTEFEFGADFEDDAFDMGRNLTSWGLSGLQANETSNSLGFIEPTYIPEGIAKNTPKYVEKEDGKAIVIKYNGEYNYSLTQSKPQADKAVNVSAPEMSQTNIVDLGFGIGIMTEMTNTRNLTWTYDGVEFKLAGDLPAEEMVQVAKSVFGQAGK